MVFDICLQRYRYYKIRVCDKGSIPLNSERKLSLLIDSFLIRFSLIFFLIFSLIFSLIFFLIFSLKFSLLFSLIFSHIFPYIPLYFPIFSLIFSLILSLIFSLRIKILQGSIKKTLQEYPGLSLYKVYFGKNHKLQGNPQMIKRLYEKYFFLFLA